MFLHSWWFSAQVLTNKDRVFFRIADERGWTHARDPADGKTSMFDEVPGQLTEDT